MKLPCDVVGLAVLAACVVLALAAAPLALGSDAAPGDVDVFELVGRAFERTFHQPGVRSVQMRIERSGRVVSHRAFELAYRTDGRTARSLLRFTEPEYLRGTALLIVDQDSASDTWLFQPSERRARRVGVAQKADSFYGSDVSLEDLERTHWERWRLASQGDAAEAGRDCRIVEAIPGAESQYGRLLVWIDRQLLGVARIDFHRPGALEPFKRLRVALAGATEERGFLRIGGLEVEQIGRDARTVVELTRLAIDPNLAAGVFSAMQLERGGSEPFERSSRGDERSED
jgi:hypothetical protein